MNHVLLSIDQPDYYFKTFGEHFVWQSSNDVDPLLAAHYILMQHDIIGSVDWRACPDELRNEVDRLLTKCGLSGFDWTFLDQLANDADLGNVALLNAIAERVRDRGVLLIYLFFNWDNYDFAIVSEEALLEIEDVRADISNPLALTFEIRRSFS